MAAVVDGFGHRFGFPVNSSERNMLTLSLPTWRPFPDTVQTLHSLQTRYRLAVISNIDDDLLAASLSQLTVPFEQVVTSGQTACYKPRLPIFEEALRRLQAGPGTVAHIAEGADEVVPAGASAARRSGSGAMAAPPGFFKSRLTWRCPTSDRCWSH